jgi:FAD/FMN-containing dehydrogenase
VAKAIALARGEGLEIAVRGGAHNVAGNATVDRGLVIDLSGQKAIRVDAKQRRAVAEPGLTSPARARRQGAFGSRCL